MTSGASVLASAALMVAMMGCGGDTRDPYDGIRNDGVGWRDGGAPADSAGYQEPESVCGDGIVEGDETCDGLCPSDCDDSDPCTDDVLHGSAETCDAYCTNSDREPTDGDGCCSIYSNANVDDDCDPVCGNFVVEEGEICDDGNTDDDDDCSSDCAFNSFCPQGVTEGAFTVSRERDLGRLTGCAEVTGDLELSAPEIEGVEPLGRLESVGGDLYIFGNATLASLAGLESLTSVGGNLEIITNQELVSLSGLDNLQEIGGDLYLDNNMLLSDLSALGSLVTIEGSLRIVNSPGLSRLLGLNSLASVGGDLVVRENEWLSDLNGLDGLTSVGGILLIYRNPRLVNLHALGSLASVGGDFTVVENTGLPSCEAEWLRDSIGLDNISGLVAINGNDPRGVCQ
jgi:cysteine-rich repeat protein